MSALDIFGWVGVLLLVVSLLQSRMMRLRVLNLVSCVLLIAYNGILGVWPMVGMNAAVALINLWFIRRLLAERTSAPEDDAREVPPAGSASPVLVER